jgi:hypothetical protein
VTNKNIEIKEFLNKSPEKVIEEKENIKSYNDTQNSNTNKTKNLNVKCKINYNVFSNENNVRKINKKIKNNNNLNNKNNNNNNNNKYMNSSINKGNTAREKELKNYNSYRNKKTIKKIMLKSDKSKIEEDEKNNTSNINNPISPIMIKERKIKKDFEITKKVSNISFINILKDNPKILSTILQYLSFRTKIYFLSISKYLSQERTSLLNNKKEELILILQLKENETIEDKIKTLKNSCSGKDKPLNDKEFKISKNTIKNLKQLNENQNIKLFKENQINNNKINEINI